MKKIIFTTVSMIIFVGVSVGALVYWKSTSPVSFPKDPGKSWVSIEPIQCLGNAWETDWIKMRGNTDEAYGAYPRNDTAVVDKIVQEFYAKKDISVFDIKRDSIRDEQEKPIDQVCLSCRCAQGYVLYLQITDDKVNDMQAFGYELVVQ